MIIRTLSAFSFLLFIHIMNAQNPGIPGGKNTNNMTDIDLAEIRVWYALNALDILDSNTYDDLQRLDIGKHFSKYYSFFVFNSDSLITKWKLDNKNAQAIPTRLGIKGKKEFWSELFYSEYFKDFSSNTLTEYSRMPFYLHRFNCQYTEKTPIFNWHVCEDTLRIMGYYCQKATCTFRGRKYTAWFCADIPINNGPWKFGGLPGLILKVYDENNLFIFECIKIEKKKETFYIKIYNDYHGYIKRERKYVTRLQKEINENYAGVAGLRLIKGRPPKTEKRYSLELE